MLTTQKQIRAAFWAAHPHLPRRRHRYDWHQDNPKAELVHHVDTRCAFVDFLDALHRAGEISNALAQRATLN